MNKSTKPATTPPTFSRSGINTDPAKSAVARQQFLGAALTMSWQLAVAVLVPVLGGVELGKHLGSQTAWVLAGLGVALIGSGVVMLQAMRAANRLPVPELTAKERRAVQKSYEEEDDD